MMVGLRKGSWSVNAKGLENLKTISIGKNKANLMLCIINRGVLYKSPELISKL